MHAVMVPDLYQSAFASGGGVPFAQAASDHHTKTLDAVWRQHASQAAFSELPCKQLTPRGTVWPGADMCATPTQASMAPASMAPAQTSLLNCQTALYPGRAVPVPAPAPVARQNGCGAIARPQQEPMKDLTSPLFVDTSVEYDLPKEAYPPQHSAPLLIVHPQYYEHLRHRRTLAGACCCQLCSFYGRKLVQTSQTADAAPQAGGVPTRPAVSAAVASAAAAEASAFQRPLWPSGQYQHQLQPSLQHHQQQLLQQQPAFISSQHQLLPQHQQLVASSQSLTAQHSHMVAAQQRHQQQQQQLARQQQLASCQQQQRVVRVQHGAPAPRYSCLMERPATFVTPTVSCDSDSGYSSVELEPADWCRAPPATAPDTDARDVMAKRKRRHDQALEVAAAASKRHRPSLWQPEFSGCAV